MPCSETCWTRLTSWNLLIRMLASMYRSQAVKQRPCLEQRGAMQAWRLYVAVLTGPSLAGAFRAVVSAGFSAELVAAALDGACFGQAPAAALATNRPMNPQVGCGTRASCTGRAVQGLQIIGDAEPRQLSLTAPQLLPAAVPASMSVFPMRVRCTRFATCADAEHGVQQAAQLLRMSSGVQMATERRVRFLMLFLEPAAEDGVSNGNQLPA